jgi:hypothetical protein
LWFLDARGCFNWIKILVFSQNSEYYTMSNYKGTPIFRALKFTQINIEKNKKY